MLRNATQLEGFVVHATDGELGSVYQLYFDDETWAIRYLTVDNRLAGRPASTDLADFRYPRRLASQAIGCRADERAGEEQPKHRYGQARLPAARDRIQRILRISLLLGWSLPVGPSLLPGRRTATAPQNAMVDGSQPSRRIHICAVPKPSPAITLRRPTVKSAMWMDLSSTIKPGLSATSRWRPRIGGRGRRYWFRPHGFNG